MSITRPRIIVVAVLSLVFAGAAHAAAPTGYALGENIGWLNWGTPEGAVNVPDSGDLTGYVWGENVGWISLNCLNTSSCGAVSYAVTRTGTVLSGYAWGENVGWISFNCSNTASCGAVSYGVTSGPTAATPTPIPGGTGPGGVVIVFPPGGSVTPTPTVTPTMTPTPPGPTPTPRPGVTPGPGRPVVSPPVTPPPVATPTVGPTIPPSFIPGPIMGAVQAIGDFLDQIAQFFARLFSALFSLFSWLLAPLFSLPPASLSSLSMLCSGPLGIAACTATGIALLVVIAGIIFGVGMLSLFGDRLISLAFWLGLVLVPLNAWFRPSAGSWALLILFLIASAFRMFALHPPFGTTRHALTGRPLPFARVTLSDANGAQVGFAVSDQYGRYRLPAVHGAEYDLHVATPEHITPPRAKTVRIRGNSRTGRKAWITTKLDI